MNKISLLLVIVLSLSACVAPKSTGETISGCRALVDGVSALQGGTDIPENFITENPVKQGGEFDVMQYFSVLDHLSMKPGYVLDYVYHYDGMGGYPVLYARPADQPPFATEADLAAGGDKTNYLDYVRTDDTPEGYFQYVVLAMKGGQFYLFWHANYNDTQIVCNKSDVTDIVASANGSGFGLSVPLISQVWAALLRGVDPSVLIGEQTVEIQLVTFTKWGGFYLTTYTLSRSSPHTIQDVQDKLLVPYDCGVMF